jgi:hypothetical protein
LPVELKESTAVFCTEFVGSWSVQKSTLPVADEDVELPDEPQPAAVTVSVAAAAVVRNQRRDTLFIVEHLSSRQIPSVRVRSPGRPSRACSR